jgi:molybdopterin molybdotransferase
MRTFVEVREAREIVLSTVFDLPVTHVALAEAVGRTLAGDVVADMDVPPFDNSAMDGYAVRSGDVSAPGSVLRLSGGVRAGEWPSGAVDPGTCWGITTGAPLPPGADAVVPVEQAEALADGRIRFAAATEAGRHVRRAGRDVAKGQVVITEGAQITPVVAGILAMVGMVRVPVRRRPVVVVVATGDELVPPERRPGPGQIRNSNGPALEAQAVSAGAEVLAPMHARDDAEATREVLRRALAADVLVFSGGVSMGSRDIVRDVLGEAGTEWLFWKVRQRPGKPLAFGLLGGRPVFGLPGNPVSSSVCFDQYVRPALLRMQGRDPVFRSRYRAILEEELTKAAGLHTFARGVAFPGEGPELRVRPTGPQGSNLFTSVLRANCLVHLPAAWELAPAGSTVEIEWLSW